MLLPLALGLLASAVEAQAPVGDPFPIAELTNGRQAGPDAAAQPDNTFVVVWNSEEGDGDGTAIRARRFAQDGSPISSEFAINEATPGSQWGPAVATDASGNFVVAWNGPDGGEHAVFARLFTANGTPLGGDFQVNLTGPLVQPSPKVGRNPAGDFVVSWRDLDPGNGDVMASTFDASGSVVLTEFVVNASGNYPTSSSGGGVAAGMRSDGGFAVAWAGEQDVGGFPTTDIFQQRFTSGGQPLGGEFQLSDHGPAGLYFSYRPQLSVDEADNFLVVWHTQLNLAYGAANARRTSASGVPGQIKLLGSPSEGHIASTTPSGEFVVIWQDYDCCMRGARFDPAGDLIANFPVPDFEGWSRTQVHPAGDPTDFIQVRTVGDTTNWDLIGQRYSRDIFADGFESGDTGQWSRSVP